jgi:2-keto-3-deoxy-L-arabinonate dehydratase
VRILNGIDSWRGVYPAVCTPFCGDEEVDLAAQRHVVRFALDAGAHGLVLFGLAGEYPRLSADERMRVLEAVQEEVDGRVPVAVGIGAESVAACRELARRAEAAGAAWLVLPAPFPSSTAGEGLVDFFVRAAGETLLPVMVQDAPAYLGIGLGVGFVEKVAARAENVRLVKLEAGPSELSRWLAELGPDFAIWGGDGGLYLLDCVRVGAAGIIPGTDLVDLLVRIYELEQTGNSPAAEALFARVLPTLVFEMQHSIDHYNHCAKRTLRRRGVALDPRLRRPAQPFSALSQQLLERHLEALELTTAQAPAVG